ncbi:MAG: calycin-like domain-containing protein [Bacteroidaceae bacterium]|nr:calycin-like domain-containing protein [Bacteroidaceae bacterium]
MKKIYSFLALALVSVMAMAQTIQLPGKLSVSVNEVESNMQANVFLTFSEDGSAIDFSLPNFVLVDEENTMGVGNILIENIALKPVADDTFGFEYNGNINITEGTLPGIDMWMGPMLGEVPLALKGTFDLAVGALVVDIDIDMMENLGQVIKVNFTSEAGIVAFTDQLSVTVNGESSSQEATVYFKDDEETETNTFVLPNFVLSDGTNTIPVGNIVIPGIEVEGLGLAEIGTFSFEGNINIAEGDDSQTFWMGPMLGEVPVKLQGYIDYEAMKLYVYITISMQVGEEHQDIIVTFGNSELISGVHSATLAPASQLSYDLQGRVNKGLSKGIVIENGKKVVR